MEIDKNSGKILKQKNQVLNIEIDAEFSLRGGKNNFWDPFVVPY